MRLVSKPLSVILACALWTACPTEHKCPQGTESRKGKCYLPAPEAQDQFFVVWLGVVETQQGRGWGRYLLLRMLWEMLQGGYRHAFISTDHRNHRALVFYTNMGFRVVDTSYEYVKTIVPSDRKR